MTRSPTVLHVLSQRPSLTGSGTTLDAIVQEARLASWQQHVVIGSPASEPHPDFGSLSREQIHPLLFDQAPLDFAVPGMSDVMPYRSTRFSTMTSEQLDRYRSAWKRHLGTIIETYHPSLIHSHHVWILSSLLKEIAPDTPVVTHCHATGFRQMDLCPHLADDVTRGCTRNDRFLVLRQGHADELESRLGIAADRVDVVGAGYRQDLFNTRGRKAIGQRIVYAGKYSAAKGVPWLLDAFEGLLRARPGLELHLAGSGAGAEADSLERRMAAMDGVVLHGRLNQAELAALLRTARLFVLPSFYEGVPLVLVEAAACGCRLVASDLPGVREELAPMLGQTLRRVDVPRLRSVDQPDPADLPGFVAALAKAIEDSLADAARPAHDLSPLLEDRFSWSAVFKRVEAVWRAELR
jgi:glycosyltransferase involved in cell wall biosynthesis